MPTGITWDGTFSSHAGMRQLITATPIPGAVRDWVFQGINDGASPVSQPDLVAGVPLEFMGAPTVQTHAVTGKKVVRLNGSTQYLRDLTLPNQTRPYTIALVVNMKEFITNDVLAAGYTATTTIGISATQRYIAYAGTTLTSSAGAGVVDRRDIIIAHYAGNSSILSVNNTAPAAASTGTNDLSGGVQFGRTSSGSAYTMMDLERAVILSGAMDSTQITALYNTLLAA